MERKCETTEHETAAWGEIDMSTCTVIGNPKEVFCIVNYKGFVCPSKSIGNLLFIAKLLFIYFHF